MIEPFTRLGHQQAWSVGFFAADRADRRLRRADVRARAAGPTRRRRARAPAPPSWRDAAWVGLAAVPSGLLIAVTAHISTDVAAAPLLWVIRSRSISSPSSSCSSPSRSCRIGWWSRCSRCSSSALVAVSSSPQRSSSSGRCCTSRRSSSSHGVPWRAARRRPPARPSHRVLHVDVGRRRDRRHLRRPDRAAHLLLGRGVSDPDRARDPVPARARASREPAALCCWLGCSPPRCRRLCRAVRYVDPRPTFNWTIGALLAARCCAARANPLPFAALIALAFIVSAAFPTGDGATTCAASSACTRSSTRRRPVPHSAARHHDARRRAHPRQRGGRSAGRRSRSPTTTPAPPSPRHRGRARRKAGRSASP